jgi:hypothetical protein
MFVNGSDSDNDIASASAWTPPVSSRASTPTSVPAPANVRPRSIDWARSLKRMDSEASSVGSEHGRRIGGRGDTPAAKTHTDLGEPAVPDESTTDEHKLPDFDAFASTPASSGSDDKVEKTQKDEVQHLEWW